ncbi:MAG: hypothetical protein HND47_23135 [Chloroflexi bacterium]|nr:hypothetical protein [Chloroflexota bacterium]
MPEKNRSFIIELMISGFGFFLVVALLWMPFGLKTTDIADGWINLLKVERASMISLVEGSRPLVYLPWKLSYWVSNDSFMGVGLVLAALFWGRTVVFYWILRNLRLLPPPLAFFISILFILYPADQGIFLMRALGRHTAVFFYYLALLLMILAVKRPSPLYLTGMILAEGISALIAEQGYLLMFATPLLLLADNTSTRRNKIYIVVGWYLVMLFSIINFIQGKKGHQEKILADGQAESVFQYLTEVVTSNLLAYKRVFVGGWLDVFEKIRNAQVEYWLFGLGIVLVAVNVYYLLSRLFYNTPENVSSIQLSPFLAIIAGLAVIGLTFFPYSLTSFRYVYSRVFYYAMGGGALVLGVLYAQLVKKIPKWENILTPILGGIVILLIAVNGLAQRSSLVKTSQRQQKILVSIVEQAPYIEENTTIVLLCDKRRPFTRLDYVFRAALSWTYDQEKIRALQCDSLSACDQIPYATSLIFECNADDTVTLLQQLPAKYHNDSIKYKPQSRINGYTPFPERAQLAFDFAPNPSNLAPQEWVGNSGSLNDRKVCNVSFAGDCSLLFFDDGIPTSFSQSLEVKGKAGETFKFTIWAKSRSLLNKPIALATITLRNQTGIEENHLVVGQPSKEWSLFWAQFETADFYEDIMITVHPNSDSLSIWLDDIHVYRNKIEIVVENFSFE